METILVLLIPALLAVLLMRLLLMPLGVLFKAAANSVCGFLCLWFLNSVSLITGTAIPINAVTVLAAGTLGLPGIGLLALLELLP